jgi:hypothetical protein
MTKIGVGAWETDSLGTDLTRLTALKFDWYYDWRSNMLYSPDPAVTRSVEYVPMLWDETHVNDVIPAEARRRVLVMAPHLVERNVVLVGMRVAEAFGAGKGLFFWREVKVGMVTLNVSVMPHPSGRNRMLNSPTMMRDARTFLRTVVEVGCRQCQEEPEWVS